MVNRIPTVGSVVRADLSCGFYGQTWHVYRERLLIKCLEISMSEGEILRSYFVRTKVVARRRKEHVPGNLVAQRHPFEGRSSSSLPDRKCLGFQRRSFAGSIWKQFRHQARSPRIRDLIHSHSLFRGCIGDYSFSASIAIHGTRSYTPLRSGILHSHGNMLTGSLLIVRAYPREQSPGPEKTRQE